MSDLQAPVPGLPATGFKNFGVPRGVSFAALSLLIMFIAVEGRTLWQEWSSLQVELKRARRMEVIGYPGIQPRYSYAMRPGNWFRQEGDQTLLWGGWVDGVGHTWFLTGPGDINKERILHLRGRDVQLAIDEAITESEGGDIWSRVPDESLVLTGTLAGVPTAYPLLVLDKVGVVNDQVGDRPFLVAYNPFAPESERTPVYEPVVEGRRLTMGTTGYYQDRKPMLYDRGTESLWVEGSEGLEAVAGEYKGRTLPRVVRATPAVWRAWKTEYPEGRLVVGADRRAVTPRQ